jgi:membrane-bound lytic murein transglycosylase B
MLRRLGWQADAPWLQEIVLPETLDLTLTGLDKSLPVRRWQALGVTGRHGPVAAQRRSSLCATAGGP